MLFDENDLYQILNQTSSFGSFNHINWTVWQKEKSSSSNLNLVTIHEHIHETFNQITSYGGLLTVYAYLSRETDKVEYQKIQDYLVSRCRTVHEIAATCISTLIVANTPNFPKKAEDILIENERYYTYFLQGMSLIKGITSPYLQRVALNSIMGTCLQSHKLIEVANKSITEFNPVIIDNIEFPDKRLQVISNYLSEDFWKKIIKEFLSEMSAYPNLSKIIDSENGVYVENLLVDRTLDNIGIEFQKKLDLIFRDILSQHNTKTLIGDQHLEFLESLIEEANRIYPAKEAQVPITFNKDPLDQNLNLLISMEKETLALSTQKLKCRFYILDHIPKEEWKFLTSGKGDLEHVFILSRIGERLFRNYEVINQPQEVIEQLWLVPLVCVAKTVEEQGEEIVELFWIKDPLKLIVFRKNLPDISIISSVSLLLLADESWDLNWQEVLNKNTYKTVLFDLKPSIQLERIAKQFDNFSFDKVELVHKEESHCIMIFEGFKESNRLNEIYLMPCSEVQANTIVYYINTRLNLITRQKMDNPNSNILFLLSHIISKEIFFDFNALNSQFAKEAFKQDEFRTDI